MLAEDLNLDMRSTGEELFKKFLHQHYLLRLGTYRRANYR
jgi:hypothetical protein